MTPERIAEINARTKGDPMAMGRALTAELNRTEHERDEARAVAGRLLANIELWLGFPAAHIDPGTFPAWLLEAAKASGPGEIKSISGGS